MRIAAHYIALLLLGGAAAPLWAQTNSSSPTPATALAPLEWKQVSMDGIWRADGIVDSVFIARRLSEGTVGGADWVSYLAARLGAIPIPDSMGVLVAADTGHILIRSRIMDLPAETRSLFGPLLYFADSTTTLEAEIVSRMGTGVVRFVLTTIKINGFAVPESVLSVFLARVGRQYPALTKSGRVLDVAVPPDGVVTLQRNGLRVWVDPSRAPSPLR